MSFVPVVVLVVPEGVVIVLDLVIVPELLVLAGGVAMVLVLVIVPALLVLVDDLVMPAGLVIVVDFVVVDAAGVCVLLAVILDELLLNLGAAAAGGVAAGVAAGAVWARAADPPSRLSETRKPRMRFIKIS